MIEKRVNVLLSTYNGAEFILEQLESLVKQTYKNISIYIRDDGSADGTAEIVHDWSERNSGINIHILKGGGKSLGYPECFFELLRESGDADYYSFCDQDDIWHPDKIETAVRNLEGESPEIPLLFFSAFEYCDSSMRKIRDSLRMPYHAVDFHHVMFDLLEAFGFSVVINRRLCGELLHSLPVKCKRKDWWMLMMAAGMGKVLYSERSLALYRRHSKAVTIVGTSSSLQVKWIRRMRGFLGNGDYEKIRVDLREFLNKYGENMRSRDLRTIRIFSGIAPLWRIRSLFFSHRIRRKWWEDALYRFFFAIA